MTPYLDLFVLTNFGTITFDYKKKKKIFKTPLEGLDPVHEMNGLHNFNICQFKLYVEWSPVATFVSKRHKTFKSIIEQLQKSLGCVLGFV